MVLQELSNFVTEYTATTLGPSHWKVRMCWPSLYWSFLHFYLQQPVKYKNIKISVTTDIKDDIVQW